jgi:quinoprotein glucose dehydrogenase
LRKLLKDGDGEVVAQVAQVLGCSKDPEAVDDLLQCLRHTNSRVRYFAALSLGKLQAGKAVAPLLDLLRKNADEDPFLRHGAVMGLAGAGDDDAGGGALALLRGANDPSPAVRMGVLLALRRRQRTEVAWFLRDNDQLLVAEAARAIHDEPIPAARPALAEMLRVRELDDDAVLRRAIAANAELGAAENARTLVQFVLHDSAPVQLRVVAMDAIAAWSQPMPRDLVLNLWRPVPARPTTSWRRGSARCARSTRCCRWSSGRTTPRSRSIGARRISPFACRGQGSPGQLPAR